MADPGCGTNMEWTKDFDGIYLGALLTLLLQCSSGQCHWQVTVGSGHFRDPLKSVFNATTPRLSVEAARAAEGWREL